MKKNKKNIMGIYAIRVDAPNGPYFYVGKSIDIDKRMKQHIYNSQTNPKAHVDAAISQYEWYWEVMKRCNRKELNK
jgi:Uri superfamily endonuclease